MYPECFYRVSCKALITNEHGHILLAKETNGKWELLGGGLDHHEEPHEGLAREVMEETGLTLHSIASSPSYFVTFQNTTYKFFRANLVFKAKVDSLDFTPSDECTQLAYFAIEDILDRDDVFCNVKKLAQQILDQA